MSIITKDEIEWRDTPCETKEELNEWLKYFMGVYLPDCIVDKEYSNCCPLDMVWGIYNSALYTQDITNALYIANRDGGKCVKKGTPILCKSGIKKIEEVVVGDLVWTGKNWKKVLNTFDEGVKKSYSLRTTYQSELSGSERHKVQTLINGRVEWKRIRDLSRLEYVYQNSPDIEIIQNKEWNRGWLIGAIAGDGCIIHPKYGNRVGFSNVDEKIISKFQELVFEITGREATKKNSCDYLIEDKRFYELVNSYFDGRLCYDKRLKTLNHSPEFLSGFISGLLDTDAEIGGLCLVNEKLIEQCCIILRSFGVFTNKRESKDTRFSKFINKEVSYYYIYFVTTVKNHLLPIGKKRELWIEENKRREGWQRFPSEVLDPLREKIKELDRRNGWITLGGERVRTNIEKLERVYKLTTKNYLEKVLVQYSQYEEFKKETEDLKYILKGRLVEVDLISKEEEYFYDLEVEDDHSYWSNGFISHNTFGAAVAEFLLLQHDNRDVTHIGAIEKQAKRAYTYFQDFYRNDFFTEFVQKLVMERTIVKGRGTFEILPCTLASVNGPHTPLVVRDEIDTVQDLQAYKDIKGIARQMPDKRPPIEIGISTRKSAFGLVQQEVDAAEKTGMKVFTWGILEVCEKCPDSRSGVKEQILYVCMDRLETITEKEWNRLDVKTRSEYEKYIGYEGCTKNCKMFAACRGYLKNQTCTSPYLRTLDRVQKQIFESSEDWTLAQHLSIKPSPVGLVYTNYKEQRSLKSYKQMIEIFLGQELNCEDREVTLEDLVKIFEGNGLTATIGVDFGFTAPYTCELLYIDSMDNVFVVAEFAMIGIDGAEAALILQDTWGKQFTVEIVYPDIESPSNIKLLRKPQREDLEGFVCAGPKKDAEAVGSGSTYVNKDVKGGIETVRKFVKVPGTNKTKLFVHESCKELRDNFKKYHYKVDNNGNVLSDTPEKGNDHGLDALRYPLHSIYGTKIANAEVTVETETSLDYDLTAAPTVSQVASKLGLNFNDNEEIYEDLKKKAEAQKIVQTHLGVELKKESQDENLEDDDFSFTF